MINLATIFAGGNVISSGGIPFDSPHHDTGEGDVIQYLALVSALAGYFLVALGLKLHRTLLNMVKTD